MKYRVGIIVLQYLALWLNLGRLVFALFGHLVKYSAIQFSVYSAVWTSSLQKNGMTTISKTLGNFVVWRNFWRIFFIYLAALLLLFGLSSRMNNNKAREAFSKF